MKRLSAILMLVVICLAATVFFAGCTDDSSSGTTASATPSETTAPSASALYSAGDIIKNPSSSSPIAVLIISYDAATDNYVRAYIYPNNDGSWGYRNDDSTLTVSRANLEKMYTKKVTTVNVASIPTRAPTTIATETPAEVTTTRTTSSTTVTPTATTALAPKVKSVDPDKGTAGTTVSITALIGQNFVSPANVSLKKGSTTIAATDVKVDNPTQITCKIAIPAGSEKGWWDLVVTNPDKQYHQYQNAFYMIASETTSSSSSSSSTTTSSATKVTITQIQDSLLVTGGSEGYKTVGILGTNLSAATKMKLVGTNTITSSTYVVNSQTSATGFFTIPAGVTGAFYVSVADASDTTLATSADRLTIQ
ncbi:MAG: hypothetical protein GYA23_06575 [Methanomicrobiales archaeon]|nr:hypothetical protein [Methanomicrobiales archaeon]